MLTEQDLIDRGLKATIVRHPLVQHKLTLMRKKEQPTSAFRALLREISWLLCFEVTRDLAAGKPAYQDTGSGHGSTHAEGPQAGFHLHSACR